MKIREDGKDHIKDDHRCPICVQGLSPLIARYPYVDSSGNPPRGGLVHSEVFGELATGQAAFYKCDKCGESH